MNRFAALLDRLAYEPRRNAKLALIADHFRSTPDPERGFALAAMTGALSFRNAKPGLVRGLIAERTDPVLFGLSYDYVGDLSETVALMWPAPEGPARNEPPPTLSEVVTTLATTSKTALPRILAGWLDHLDETGRWALLKLITGSLRIGVSARLAKTAVAALGDKDADEIELVWPGLAPPYEELFAWVEGRGPRPEAIDPAPFRPPMLAHGIEDEDFAKLDPADFAAEWKWDGIRVQAAAGTLPDGRRVARLYSRTGEDISAAFPDLAEAMTFDGAIDGELLVLRETRVQSFNVLQQRLNRKQVTPAMLVDFPAHIRAYDLLFADGEDLRERPFAARRALLEAFIARIGSPRIDLSPLVPFDSWDALAASRLDPASAEAGEDAEAIEGLMIKRRTPPTCPGGRKGSGTSGSATRWRSIACSCTPSAATASARASIPTSPSASGAPAPQATSWCRRQGLFRLHRRGIDPARPFRPQPYRQPLWAGARGRPQRHGGAGSGDRLRGPAALDAAQVGRRHALSPHLAHPLGQAAGRGRPDRGAGGATQGLSPA